MAIFKSTLIEITGLTADNTWRSVDLSGSPYQIPASATGVMLVVRNANDSTTYSYGLRKPGSQDDFVGDIVPKAQYTAFVGCVNSIIQYRIQTSSVKLYLAGYFGPEATFFTNKIKKTHTVNEQWETVNLAGDVSSSALFGIFEIIDTNSRPFGLQPNGAQVHNALGIIRHHTWAICPLDDDKKVAVYANTTNHSIYLVGFINTGKRELYPQGQYTNNNLNTWEDFDLTSETPPTLKTGAIFDVLWSSSEHATNRKFLMRPNGASYDWDNYSELRGHCWFLVPIDSEDICEAKSNASGQIFLFQGFLDDPLYAEPLTANVSMEAWVLGQQIQAPLVANVSAEASASNISIILELPTSLSFNVQVANNVLSLSWLKPQVETTAKPGYIGDLRLDFPIPSISFRTPAQFSLTLKPVISAYALVGFIGKVNIEQKLGILRLDGKSSELGKLDISIKAPQIYLKFLPFHKGNISLTLYNPSIFFVGKKGEIGRASLDLTSPSISLLAKHSSIANLATVFLPGRIYLTTDQFLVKILKTFVMNMTHFGVSEYLDFDFNSYAFFNGELLCAKSNGIYSVKSDRDNGTRPIEARIKAPIVDKDIGKIKRLREVWLTGRFENEMKLILEGDENVWWEDRFDRPGNNKLQEMRCKLAKGLKNRFVSIELKNDGGGDFDLDKIRITGDIIDRRIR